MALAGRAWSRGFSPSPTPRLRFSRMNAPSLSITSPRARLRARRALAALAAAVALTALAAVLFARGGGPATTAFANAPAGQYAVVTHTDGAASVIGVVNADDGRAIEVATVPHLPGFAPRGAVSPNGRWLALVAATGGVPAQPLAALLALHLETGELRVLAANVDPLQEALWTPDSGAVVVTREGPDGVAVLRVGLDGAETALERREALAVAPVGFDAAGRLLAVVLDGRGSTLTRGGADARRLSAHLTRDWALSPDGAALAFVEANLDGGLRYLPRVAALAAGAVSAASASIPHDGQALGAVWPPAGGAPRFGHEPDASPGGVRAQAAGGFDVPLGFSRDGAALAVRRWSGSSFAEPGDARLQIVAGGERRTLDGFSRFHGWTAR